MPTHQWYCQMMGSELGPFSQDQLVERVRKRQLGPEDLVRRDDSDWLAAFEVTGLMEAAARPAKPPNNAAPPRSEKADTQTAATKESQSEPKDDSAPTKTDDTDKKGEQDRVDAPVSKDPAERRDWFCLASGEKHGPIGFSDLQAMAEDGRLAAQDRVWRTSQPKFKSAIDVEGLIVGSD